MIKSYFGRKAQIFWQLKVYERYIVKTVAGKLEFQTDGNYLSFLNFTCGALDHSTTPKEAV